MSFGKISKFWKGPLSFELNKLLEFEKAITYLVKLRIHQRAIINY